MPRNPLLPAALALLTVVTAARAEPPSAADIEFFESKVRPVLVARCYKCHSQDAENLRGSLLLDSQPGWMAGGDSGPAIVPGDPAASLLVKALQYVGDVQMPPEGKLPDGEIAVLTEWVKRGAPDPRVTKPAGKAKRTINIDEGRKHWAFQPLAPQVTPYVADPSWCRTPVDRFIVARLNEKQLTPNAAAEKRTLIRRAYLDLLGLPPKPDEVEAFVADLSPDAYDRLVERLLDSPHYGERWARHWLDLARFAESHGFEHDYDRLSAYHYRDFVIKALNRDLPYDTFVKWQIAGDEYEPENPLALMATGYLAAGVHSTQITKNQVEKERYDELDDMSATIGTSMLGLTIGCARCHDHKFDPIPTADYYRLLSTFTTAVRSEVDLNLDQANYDAALAAFQREHAPLAAALAQYEAQELPSRFDAWLASLRGTKRLGGWWLIGRRFFWRRLDSGNGAGDKRSRNLADSRNHRRQIASGRAARDARRWLALGRRQGGRQGHVYARRADIPKRRHRHPPGSFGRRHAPQARSRPGGQREFRAFRRSNYGRTGGS